MTRIHISREDLYEMVWTRPIVQVAEDFGLSDKGFAKICNKLDIPLPGRGYWQKLSSGQEVDKDALPKSKGEQFAEFWEEGIGYRKASRAYINEPTVLQSMEFEAKGENKIVIPDKITRYDPLIKETVEILKLSRINDYGRCKTNDECLVDVSCAKQSIPRVAKILQTLITSLKLRGHHFKLASKTDYYGVRSDYLILDYNGESIKLSLKEKADRTLAESSGRSYWPVYDYKTNGKLTLKVEGLYYCYTRHVWSDTKNRSLESMMNAIMVDLAKVSIFIRDVRLEEEKNELKRQHEEQSHQRLEEERLKEEEMIQELDSMLENWEKAKQIRAFLLSAEAIAESIDENWLAWVKQYADRLDPLIESVDNTIY